MLSEAHIVIREVATAFDTLNIPYMVGGSVASSFLGFPRLTNDVDFVARLTDTAQADPLSALLQSKFYVDADMIRDAIRLHSSFNIIYLKTMTKSDIFVPDDSPWRLEEWSRRCIATVGSGEESMTFTVCSGEYAVLQKLLWYRMTGERSDRHWGDVQGVLRVQADRLDRAYLRHWATELGIADLLRRAFAEVGWTEDPA